MRGHGAHDPRRLGPTAGGSIAKRFRRDGPDEKKSAPAPAPVEPEPEEELEDREAAIERLAEERAKKAAEFQRGKTAEEVHWLIMGITPEVVESAKSFVRPFETEAEMIQVWMSKRDGWREDIKRKHRDALRRQKRNRQGGDKFYE